MQKQLKGTDCAFKNNSQNTRERFIPDIILKVSETFLFKSISFGHQHGRPLSRLQCPVAVASEVASYASCALLSSTGLAFQRRGATVWVQVNERQRSFLKCAAARCIWTALWLTSFIVTLFVHSYYNPLHLPPSPYISGKATADGINIPWYKFSLRLHILCSDSHGTALSL